MFLAALILSLAQFEWNAVIDGHYAASSDYPVIPCLDSLRQIQKFQDGELEQVYQEWDRFFKTVAEIKGSVSLDCATNGQRTMGLLRLFLWKDTTGALLAFQSAGSWNRRRHLWDMRLPYELQSAWDGVRDAVIDSVLPAEIWEDKWLPAPIYAKNAPKALYALRGKYHDLRLQYALASTKVSASYDTLLVSVFHEKDKAFSLLKLDVKLRLGRPPMELRKDLDQMKTVGPSEIIRESDYSAWLRRLQNRVEQEENKQVATEAPSLPEKADDKPILRLEKSHKSKQ